MSRRLSGLDAIGVITLRAPLRATMDPAPTPTAPRLTAPVAAPLPTAVPYAPPPPLQPTISVRPMATPPVAPPPTLTARAADPTAARQAADQAMAAQRRQAAKAKLQDDALRLGQKLAAAASKVGKRSPQMASKFNRIAASVKRKADTKILAGHRGRDPMSAIARELMGEMMTATALTPQQVANAVAEWNLYQIAANAVALLSDVFTQVAPLVDQLQKVNQATLAQQGKAILDRCQGVVDHYDPEADPPDPSLGQAVISIQTDAQAWLAQAQTAVAQPYVDASQSMVPPAGLDPATGLPINPATGQPDPAYAYGASSGGGGGGGGASDGGFGGSLPTGGSDATGAPESAEDFEAAADDLDTEEGLDDDGSSADEDDPFADVMGELFGRAPRRRRRRRVLGADTIPSAGQEYTDAATVLAVQTALKAKGFNPGPLDGVMGPQTAKALRLLQAAISAPVTGKVDESVLMALKVTPSARPTPSPAAPGDQQVIHSPNGAAAATGESVFVRYLKKPLWTGSPVKIWQASVGAGVAVVLSSMLLAIVRRRK